MSLNFTKKKKTETINDLFNHIYILRERYNITSVC